MRDVSFDRIIPLHPWRWVLSGTRRQDLTERDAGPLVWCGAERDAEQIGDVHRHSVERRGGQDVGELGVDEPILSDTSERVCLVLVNLPEPR